MKQFVIGITGASGSIYANRLMGHLKDLGHRLFLIPTEAGEKVASFEKQTTNWERADKIYKSKDYFAPVASGSHPSGGMVVLPCSMGTLAKIATGVADNLLCRAADVHLKEKRKLILVPRENPFSLIHLENMVRAARAGASILPANPHFYHGPQSIEDAVDTVLARVLDHLEVEHDIGKRWGES